MMTGAGGGMQQYFMIVSRMHGLVLDVQGGNKNPGTPVVPWNKTGSENQLWYDDHATGTIRSKINGFCLDIEGSTHFVYGCPKKTNTVHVNAKK